MKNGNKTYQVSQGGGQYFEIQGDFVKIICTYEFNPSIERTKYNPTLQKALQCEPCTEEQFKQAEQLAMEQLDITFPIPTPSLS